MSLSRRTPLRRGTSQLKRSPLRPVSRKRGGTNSGAFRILRDGREIIWGTPAGRREYNRRKSMMRDRQDGACFYCGKSLPADPDQFSFEHDPEHGRGMGGSRRDDRIFVNGKRLNCAVHFCCNGNRTNPQWSKPESA